MESDFKTIQHFQLQVHLGCWQIGYGHKRKIFQETNFANLFSPLGKSKNNLKEIHQTACLFSEHFFAVLSHANK